MGEAKYEHTQNVTMQRILQACLTLQSVREDMAAAAAAAAASSDPGAGSSAQLNAAALAAVADARRSEALQRFMSGWLRLQNEVNALIDSTTAENTDQAVRRVRATLYCCSTHEAYIGCGAHTVHSQYTCSTLAVHLQYTCSTQRSRHTHTATPS
jgi:hypothetical protein